MRKLLVSLLMLASCARGEDRGIDKAPTRDPGGFDADAGTTPEGKPPCLIAAESRSSVGCEYYAVDMDGAYAARNGCFVAFVANTSDKPAHVSAEWADEAIDLSVHAKIPKGTGRKLQYTDFDATQGIPPGEVAILFLAGVPTIADGPQMDWQKPTACPVAPARNSLAQRDGTGLGYAFHIRTDVPVVAYQMLPYGGGSAAVTGASLLIPTSAWDTNYIAVNPSPGGGSMGSTSLNIVASQDDTTVTILPKTEIYAGPSVPTANAGEPFEIKLQAGQHLQITQNKELTGSPVQADKPIGMYSGHPCLTVPLGVPFCDHGEQSIPPVRALGHEYALVTYRPRTAAPENPPYRFVGAVDGTVLTYEPASTPGPRTLNLGEVAEFTNNGRPFVVRSQDKEHPFIVTTYMTGSSTVAYKGDGYGDADFIRVVPLSQYLSKYVFFTDPTYPETNLVITREKIDGKLADVELDCAGVLSGWQPIDASGRYEFTRIDLSRHDFQPQNGCDNGRHVMKSAQPFGLSVWGWGTTETKSFTRDVSYSYPAGENLAPLNTVTVPARPK
jgi:hypothetical protein